VPGPELDSVTHSPSGRLAGRPLHRWNTRPQERRPPRAAHARLHLSDPASNGPITLTGPSFAEALFRRPSGPWGILGAASPFALELASAVGPLGAA
jgi:hypothetical protein